MAVVVTSALAYEVASKATSTESSEAAFVEHIPTTSFGNDYTPSYMALRELVEVASDSL